MESVVPVTAAVLPVPSAPAAELIAATARTLERRFGGVTAELMAFLDAQMPELAGDEDFHDQTHATARASTELITAMALTWTDPRDLQAPHEALEWARRSADRGITAETILRAYRLGHARYWELWYAELCEQGEGDAATLAEATAASSTFFFRWIDAVSAPLLQAHEEQRDRRVRSADAVRADTVRRILEQAPVDEPAAAARLGYELSGRHVAMITWIEGETGDPAGTVLEDVATLLARRLGGPQARPLIVRDGALALWAWVRSFDGFEEVALEGVDLGDPRVRVALGRPGPGIEGFRDSHLQARVAQRVARLAPGGSPLLRYDDETGVLALLTNDVDRARRFVRRTLGPLAAGDEPTRRLLDTLRVFQAEGQSFARTAARLQVHQNTAAYRVKRALELAGNEDASSLALRAAVALVPLVGDGEPGARP